MVARNAPPPALAQDPPYLKAKNNASSGKIQISSELPRTSAPNAAGSTHGVQMLQLIANTANTCTSNGAQGPYGPPDVAFGS